MSPEHITSEQAVEMFGRIPQVATSFTVYTEQVRSEYGHVTEPSQAEMYFSEVMRIMDARGIGFQVLVENGIKPNVLQGKNDLLRELRVGDEVVMITDTVELDKQIRFDQAMTRGGKDVGSHTYTVDFKRYEKRDCS